VALVLTDRCFAAYGEDLGAFEDFLLACPPHLGIREQNGAGFSVPLDQIAAVHLRTGGAELTLLDGNHLVLPHKNFRHSLVVLRLADVISQRRSGDAPTYVRPPHLVAAASGGLPADDDTPVDPKGGSPTTSTVLVLLGIAAAIALLAAATAMWLPGG
jgi:hypothetical protein